MRTRGDLARLILAGAIVALIAGWPGPAGWIERRIAPVIKDLGATEISRDNFLACWTWTFRKLRLAKQKSVDLDAYLDSGRRIDGAPLVWGESGLRYFMSDLTSAPSPEPQSRIVCLDLVRARVAPEQGLTVVMSASYVARPGLWQTPYTMAPIAIPPAR